MLAHKYAQTAVQLATLMGLLSAADVTVFASAGRILSATRSRGIARQHYLTQK
ncbi:MAG: hypothetical protein ACLUTF_09710 [Anaerostipes hadrus]